MKAIKISILAPPKTVSQSDSEFHACIISMLYQVEEMVFILGVARELSNIVIEFPADDARA